MAISPSQITVPENVISDIEALVDAKIGQTGARQDFVPFTGTFGPSLKFPNIRKRVEDTLEARYKAVGWRRASFTISGPVSDGCGSSPSYYKVSYNLAETVSTTKSNGRC